MLPDSLLNSSLTDMLDALPNGVIWVTPVYDEQKNITDFIIEYLNKQVLKLAGAAYTLRAGMSVRQVWTTQRKSPMADFDQLLIVFTTGIADEFSFQNEAMDRWFTVRRSKLNGGVLNVLSDETTLRQANQLVKKQADLMQDMLDGSLNGILLLEPICDDGKVTNFRIVAANQTLGDMTGVDGQTIIGRPMLEVYPGYKANGFFDFCCLTTADGQPRQAEYYQEDTLQKGWFEVSITRQQQYLVLTTSDVTKAHAVRHDTEMATRHLQSVIDVSQVGIFVFSPVIDKAGQLIDFRFKTVNRMVAALVGQTPDVITGAVASDWFISYRETGLFDHYRHTYLTGEVQRFNIHYNVDGFDVWFDVQSVKMGDEVFVTFTDYTLLKQAQQALERQVIDNQRQSDFINGVLDSSESGIIAFEAIRDPARDNGILDFRFVMANRACVGLLGRPLDDMIGNTLLSIFPGNVETGLFDLYKTTTETGQPGRTEVYYDLDGLDFWLDISVQQLGDGFVVTFTDISPIKRANKAIEQSAAELTTVVDLAQTGIFLFEPVFDEARAVVDFRFRLANRQLAAYVGQEPAALIGALGSHWFPDYKTNGLFESYLKAYTTGRAQRFDFHYDGGGIDVWLDIMATKVGNEVLVTFADYTNLKRLQHQLQHSIADLSRSNESLQQFAYVASHDLQEPLRKIQSFGSMLQTRFGSELGEMGSDLISRMQVAAGRMSNLIHDLLAYSRLSSPPAELTPISLLDVLVRVLDDLDLPIRESGAVVHTNNLPTVPGDASQLRQLFQNLLTNALKFRQADKPPVITINSHTVAADDLPQWVVPTRKVAVYQCISLKDNGIGFDQKYADRIFQVFQRLHARAHYDGTGIGLAIVQRVVDNHGGAIEASSVPGEGATFSVYLPAQG